MAVKIIDKTDFNKPVGREGFWAMRHETVLGDVIEKPGPKKSPVMHCQRRYFPALAYWVRGNWVRGCFLAW